MLFYTPISYFFGVLASPVALYSYLQQAITSRPTRGYTYRKVRKTRFNEDLDAAPDIFDEAQGQQVIQGILKKNAPAEAELARPSNGTGRNNASRPTGAAGLDPNTTPYQIAPYVMILTALKLGMDSL